MSRKERTLVAHSESFFLRAIEEKYHLITKVILQTMIIGYCFGVSRLLNSIRHCKKRLYSVLAQRYLLMYRMIPSNSLSPPPPCDPLSFHSSHLPLRAVCTTFRLQTPWPPSRLLPLPVPPLRVQPSLTGLFQLPAQSPYTASPSPYHPSVSLLSLVAALSD